MELAYSNTSIKKMNKPKAKVITISSGKGGVGKSSTATNLALSLAALNKKVCVFDADASLANINILLGIQPKFTLQHLLKGEKSLKDIIIDGPRGLKIVPGATGIAEYAHLSDEQKTILLAALDKLQQEFDYLIIDTAAGIADDVLDFIKASQFSIIIITPEPTSLTDSFSLLKVLKRSNYNRTSYILVNMAMDFDNSQSIYKRFESAVKKYIEVDISYLGYIQVDEAMISSVSLQCPTVLLSPDSKATACFKKLALGLDEETNGSPIDSFSDFWRQQGGFDNASIETPSESPRNTFILEPKKTDHTTQTPTPPLDFEQAAAFCIKELSSGDLSEQETITFCDTIKQYQSQQVEEQPEPSSQITPSSVREFYNYLEQNSFPKDDIREVVATLEQVYFEKYGQSLSSLDSTTLKLFSQFSGSEEDLLFVNQRLSDCFQRQFDKPLYDVIEHIQGLASSDEFDRQAFEKTLNQLLTAYQQRFSDSYKTKADEDLELAEKEITALQEKLNALKIELSNTNNTLVEKNALLKKIQQLLPNS
ncbi:motility protein MotR [Cycloclasticus sp. 44_32_T64]|nr:motility protein MotR [Cycloclasticus sp. 44_32_T64]